MIASNSALALLRAVAEANAARNFSDLDLTLIETARLHIEMGKPRAAQVFLASVLQSASPGVSIPEPQRAWVNLLQARVAAGQIDEARTQLAEITDSSPE